jgi:cobyrinic acid a,c-diamide synthase
METLDENVERIYSLSDRKGSGQEEEGFLRERVLGSYVHLHWGSSPDTAGHFVEYCRRSPLSRPTA